MDHVRRAILKRVKERNLDLKKVSLEIGKNHAYLQQFIERGVPVKLKEDVRARISEVLDIPEEELGAPPRQQSGIAAPSDFIDQIATTAGMGGGGLTITENTTVNGITFHKEMVQDHWRIPAAILSKFGALPNHIKAFPSQGDSMFPTIVDGDVVFADTRHQVPSPPGVYVLADQFGGVIIKRLEVISRPSDETVVVRISSDNSKHRDQELTLDEITIIGRYVGRFTVM